VTLWAVLLCLLFMPFYQIGTSSDFQMRSSIMPLTLLAIAFAGWLTRIMAQRPIPRVAFTYAILALLIGAVTPALEIRRALVNRPTPVQHCSLVGVWMHQSDKATPTSTYLARTSALPPVIRNIPARAALHDPAQCWDRPWKEPRVF
jgi:hypothetical protein